MVIIISAIKIIFLLGFLIFIHETGHLLVAKLCKVKVNEFAIGFGPTILKKQGRETKYAIRLIPLGGFCSMEGEEERSENQGSFSKASIPKRIAIVAAGAIVNILFGLIIYFILMSTSNTYITNQINSTIDGYIAQEIELQENDKIIELDGKKINNKYDLNKVIKKYNGEELKLKIKRNEDILEYNIKLTEVKIENTITETDNNYITSYYLGVNLKQAEDTFINHIIYGVIETKEFAFSLIDNIKLMFTGRVSVEQMMGPVGISEVVAKTNGFKEFVYILALVSLSLGITNLLPIPALDGGRILILIIEAIRKKPLKEKTEINIQLIGFSILIVLSLFVTYNDILRIL